MTAKLRNMASLSFLACTNGIPVSIELNQHSLGFTGEEKSMLEKAEFVTGVYGSHSQQVALVIAAKWAREREMEIGLNRVLMIDSNYKVDNYSLTRMQTRNDICEQTGWLNMNRLATAFREEIKEKWLDWIDCDSAFGVAERLENKSLLDIAVQYPKYVLKMMRENPFLKGVIHPVNPTLDPSVCIFAATVRLEKDRFHGAHARYMPAIEVVV